MTTSSGSHRPFGNTLSMLTNFPNTLSKMIEVYHSTIVSFLPPQFDRKNIRFPWYLKQNKDNKHFSPITEWLRNPYQHNIIIGNCSIQDHSCTVRKASLFCWKKWSAILQHFQLWVKKINNTVSEGQLDKFMIA